MDYNKNLVIEARKARESAYAPYSKFKVGAALLTGSGKIFRGVNVENVSFSQTICAERSAVVAAITAGEMDFVEIAVVADTHKPTTPCGACRQFLIEFGPSLKVVVANLEKVHLVRPLRDLLPWAFDLETLESTNES